MKMKLFILGLLSLFFLNEYFSDFRFGVSNYNQNIFIHSDYYWESKIDIPELDIKLEHLVLANEFDSKLIHKAEKGKDFLTVFNFINASVKRIVSIEVETKIDNKKLEPIKFYTYKQKNNSWDIKYIDSLNSINSLELSVSGIGILYSNPYEIKKISLPIDFFLIKVLR